MSTPCDSDRYLAHPGAEPFLLLKENHFAFAAVEQLGWREQPATQRLVFLSGPAGSGKSHLARQFVRHESSVRPSVRIAHLTAAEFAAEFAEAAENRAIHRFQQSYRSLQTLVLEDIGALVNRFATLQQLCFVLDEILINGGRVLLSNRRPPGELHDMPPRLINRCRSGVCAVIRSLGYSSRVSIVEHFAQTRQMPIPPDAARLLAHELPVSPRELLATIAQLDHYARHSSSQINQVIVCRYLDGEVKPKPPTLTDITRAVARCFHTTATDLRSHSRKQAFVVPRQCAIYLARSLTPLSLSRIAEFFGQRHHSSVAHAYRRMKLILHEQPDIRQHLVQICNTLNCNGESICG
ncbi:MAG: ATP-binding protein [Planctomycetes bacterium]|nr:ATP-binding protein [Planctomycetota bacterium]